MISIFFAWALLWAAYLTLCTLAYRLLTKNPSLVLTPQEMAQKQMTERKPVTVRRLKESYMKVSLPGFMMRGVYLGVALGTVYGIAASVAPTVLRLPNLVEVDYNRFLVLDQDKIQQFHVTNDSVPMARVDGMPDMPVIPEAARPQPGGNLQQRAESTAAAAGMGGSEDLNAKALREALQRQLPADQQDKQ